jgi:hypothetical protein
MKNSFEKILHCIIILVYVNYKCIVLNLLIKIIIYFLTHFLIKIKSLS